ncbi:sn-glycerol-3-phosphate import ATP-binding protein UgpC [compost metagenome]
MTLGDKVAVMKDGVIQQFGTPQQIYNDPANLFVASFIGSPPMNFIPLVPQWRDGCLRAALDGGLSRLELALTGMDASLDGRELILGVRPEQLLPVAGRGEEPATLRAAVQVVEPTGPDTLAFVELNGASVCCRLAPDAAPAAGEVLALQLAAGKPLLFDAASGERLGNLVAAPTPARVAACGPS